VQGSRLFRADADGKHPHPVATIPADFVPFYTRWVGDGRLIYCSGAKTDGSYLIYAVPATGGPLREVAHSEGPTFQNLRFTFNVRGDVLYFVLADRQSDVWMAEVAGK
jgi:Tol biopolymer transport system component